MGDCQNYGPFLGPYYNTGPNLGDPKRGHNFANPPYRLQSAKCRSSFFRRVLHEDDLTGPDPNEQWSKLLKGRLYRGLYRGLL